MAIYSNLPVYQETYKLFLHFVKLASNMQRDFRYTLGEQTKMAIMDIMLNIFRANSNRDKVPFIKDAREKMIETQIIIRVLHETKQISLKQFALLMEETTNVSKQLSNWEKSFYLNKTPKTP